MNRPEANPLKVRLGAFVVIDRVDDKQDHSGLVEVVVERVEQLRDEQRQEPPAAQQMRGCKHVPPGRNPFLPAESNAIAMADKEIERLLRRDDCR